MIGPAENIDIRELAANRASLDSLVARLNLAAYDKVVLIGCAPCQGFAAHRKSYEDTYSRRYLFPIFCEVAGIISPDALFMENVPDLFSRRHWRYYREGKTLLTEKGYVLRSQIHNLATFGLPQERFRAIMVAFRHPFLMPKPLFSPEDFRTVRQAIGHLPPLQSGEQSKLDAMHWVSNHRPSTLDILARVPKDGGNRPVGVGPKCLDKARQAHGGYTDVYGRIAWDRPSVTLTAKCRTPSAGRFAHPDQDRGLSIREAALIQGFPPDFVFEGGFDSRYTQIGNAVPPLVARVVAEHMLKILRGGIDLRAVNATPEHDIVAPVGHGFAVKINGIKRSRGARPRKGHP
jgi:DNA (cytosine-5)-methyltransferase 1